MGLISNLSIDIARSLWHAQAYRYGRNVSQKYAALLKGELSSAESDAYQALLLQKTLRATLQDIPFYRRQRTSLDAENLSSFPLIDKTVIRANASSLCSSKNDRWSFQFNTGGSTGEPFFFWASRFAGYVDLFHQKYFFASEKISANSRILAFDGVAIPPDKLAKKKFWQKRGSDIPYGSYHFSAIHLNEENFPFYADKILQLNPAVLRGYPSAITALAELWRNSGRETPKTLKLIQLTAENILPHQAIILRSVFGCKVSGQYGHSEMGVFATSDEQCKSYLCSPFYGHVEILDSRGMPVAEDETGEIVVTTLHNPKMPLIRYRTGDLAVNGGRQRGMICLKSLEGRLQYEALVNKDGRDINVCALIFGHHAHYFEHIVKMQIVQREMGKATVLLQPNAEFSEKDIAEITDIFSTEANIAVEVKTGAQFELTSRGKHRMVINYLK